MPVLILGAYGNIQTINGAVGIASNIPDYTANDYVYGAGFLTEKALEAVILKRVSSKIGLSSNKSRSAFKHSYDYHSRIRVRALEDPVGHNFPYSFDDAILNTRPIMQSDGSLLYRLDGH